jgi:plastocyanin domain-containing protein
MMVAMGVLYPVFGLLLSPLIAAAAMASSDRCHQCQPAPLLRPTEDSVMSADRWLVLVAGLSLIAFIVRFFWLKRSSGVRATEGGYQEAMILVKGGYTPDTIVVRRGKPVRLNFRREETASCSDKVIFADFNKSAELPTGETVAVELLPNARGEFQFACPMGMFRGRLVVGIAGGQHARS